MTDITLILLLVGTGVGLVGAYKNSRPIMLTFMVMLLLVLVVTALTPDMGEAVCPFCRRPIG